MDKLVTSLNGTIQSIMDRKSVRLYEQTPVPKELVNLLLEAGNAAPSTGNEKLVERDGKKVKETNYQPWRFVVVETPEFKKRLFETAEPIRANFYESMKNTMPELYEMGQVMHRIVDEPKDLVFYSAPVIIYVVGPSKNNIGCAAVCENIMIAAVSLGLGTCYSGFGSLVTQNPDLVKELELDDDEKIYGPILVGYPKKDPTEEQETTLAMMRPEKKPPVVKWM